MQSAKLNKEDDDCEVKFLHPQFPARSYYWPCKDDVCCIPLSDMLTNVDLNTPTGRQYMIKKTLKALLKNTFMLVMCNVDNLKLIFFCFRIILLIFSQSQCA